MNIEAGEEKTGTKIHIFFNLFLSLFSRIYWQVSEILIFILE